MDTYANNKEQTETVVRLSEVVKADCQAAASQRQSTAQHEKALGRRTAVVQVELYLVFRSSQSTGRSHVSTTSLGYHLGRDLERRQDDGFGVLTDCSKPYRSNELVSSLLDIA